MALRETPVKSCPACWQVMHSALRLCPGCGHQMVEPRASLRLNYEELWELKNNFEASFEEGALGNELAERIAQKIDEALDKVRK